MPIALKNAALALYCFLTLCAFIFALTNVTIIPKPLFWLNYGAMAPYQGYSTNNIELYAEGSRREYTKEIDLRSYYPVNRGEYNYRTWLPSARNRSDELLKKQAERLAYQLLSKPELANYGLGTVRLYYRQWPKNPAGYYAAIESPEAQEIDLITVSIPSL